MTIPRRFFDITFSTGSIAEIVKLVTGAARASRTTMLVTPNVDHVVTLIRRSPQEVRDAYHSADIFLCDSKIIGLLARRHGLELTPRTGTDRVADVLATPENRDLVFALAGPTPEQTEEMRRRYPGWTFIHIDTPARLMRGTPEWDACVADAAKKPWNILLACLSFPKQELFAFDVRAKRQGGGVIMCVGAAVDFLSGTHWRAPMILQRFGLEWFHRLITNPRRLWRRYLVEGPKIFMLYAQRIRTGQF